MEVILKDVRIAFADIHTAQKHDDGGENFGVTPMFPQGGEVDKLVQMTIQKVVVEAWKDKATAIMGKIKADPKSYSYTKDPRTNGEGDVYDGFEGMASIRAVNKVRTLVVDARKAILTQADGKPYSGCYCNVGIDVWAQDNKHGKAVRCKLLWVQFLRDGEAFGGGKVATLADIPDLADTDGGDLV